jgi:hypothetical protein
VAGPAARAGAGSAAGEPAAAGPIVERVNPTYQPPPGTPDDLVSLRNQIIGTLATCANVERFGQLMAQQEAHHAANEKPIEAMQKANEDSISATEAHKRAIANRDEANTRKQDHEDKAKGKLKDYSDKAGQLVTLTVPLKAVAGFTGLATNLPNEPDIVLRFKRGLLKVNADSSRFLSPFDKADQAIADQKNQQAVREQGIKADVATLKSTDTKAGAAAATFDTAKQNTDDFGEKNKQRKEDARGAKTEAQKTAATLDAQARQKQGQAMSLAAAMQFWANGHRQARLVALEATRKRLEARGYRVTEVAEK